MTFRRSSLIVAFVAIVTAGGPASDRASALQQAPPAPAPPVRDGAPARPTVGTGSIAGVVTSTEAQPKPVRRARVMLSQTEQGAAVRLLVPTDDAGRFMFTGLPPGRYSVSASRPGWVTGNMGARTPGGQGLTLALTEGQKIANVTIAMARGAVITGRVVDMAGQPVIGSRVMVSERRIVNGAPSLQSGFLGLGSQTDDRGEYRAFGLKAGSYVVSVSPPPGQSTAGRMITPAELRWITTPPPAGSGPAPPPPVGPASIYAQVFYPGTTDANAAGTVTVAAGEERDSIDISLQLVTTAKVSGTVTRPDGERASGAQVIMAPIDQPSLDPFSMLRGFLPRGAVNGEFSFADLQPGRYALSARAATRTAPMPPPAAGGRGSAPPLDLWASADVTLTGDDISGLSLVLQPGMTVSGRVVFEGATPPPSDLSRVSVRLAPPPSDRPTITTSSSSVNTVAADGSFSIEGLSPGPYDLNGFAPGSTPTGPMWVLKSAVVGGRSLLDAPVNIEPNSSISGLVVTFSDKIAEISGLLLDQAGRPAPEFYVIVFPTNPARWTMRTRWLRPPTRPASDGRYRLAALPPGEYYLAALTEFDQNEWSTPAFLEQVVPGAIKITIGEGEKKTQDLKLGI